MPRGIATAALAAALILTTTQQPGTWSLVFERRATGKYEDFAFPDAQHGWLVSASGVILNTADSGRTWAVQASGLSGLRSIDFLDARRGFAGTLTGQLHATTDGGVTWKNITNQLPHAAKGFCGITHVGEKVHVVGRYNGAVADYFFSPDAGKTWRWTDLSSLAQGLVDVSFVSDSVGFIGGMASAGAPGQGPAVILKTVDGGRNWRPVFQHDGGRGFTWKVFPMSTRLIYASLQSQDGTYRMVKSVDGGEKWEVLTVVTGQREGPGVQGIGFLNEKVGWVGGFFAGMYETRDGGRTWKHINPQDGTLNRFERAGNTLFTAGTRGVLKYGRGAADGS